MPPPFEDYQKTIARIYQTHPGTDTVVGTGFLVSPQYLLTCAHVVIDGLSLQQPEDLQTKPQHSLEIDFPSIPSCPKRQARVVLWQPCANYFDSGVTNAKVGEDIALLQLDKPVAAVSPIPIDTIAATCDQPFSIYGFPNPNGCSTQGVLGAKLVNHWFQLQVDESWPAVIGGFSGAPLWHKEKHLIMGMMVATNYDHQAYAIAASSLYNIWHTQGQLLELLAGVDWSIIEPAYHHCRQQQQSWTTELPQDLPEAIADLYQMDEGQDTQEQLVNFVVCLLGDDTSSVVQKNALQQWLQAVPGKSAQEIEALYAAQQQQKRAATDPHLFVVIEKGGTGDRYAMNFCFVPSMAGYDETDHKTYQVEFQSADPKHPQPFDREAFQALAEEKLAQKWNLFFAQYFSRIVASLSHIPAIHFVLSFEAMDLPVDSWEIAGQYGAEVSGEKYPVVIKVLERYQDNYASGPQLRELCRKYQHDLKVEAALACGDRSKRKILKDLNPDAPALGLRKTCPPDAGANDPRLLIMQKGIPIALWLRKPLPDCCEDSQQEHKELLASELQALIGKIQAIRAGAESDLDFIGSHLTLLWDIDAQQQQPMTFPDNIVENYTYY
ncbi:MAG: trypsin-like peptidase domain-containing protein [Cyanobacteria bacterium P01_G01_bin.54]